jgi:hypothetical protein
MAYSKPLLAVILLALIAIMVVDAQQATSDSSSIACMSMLP